MLYATRLTFLPRETRSRSFANNSMLQIKKITMFPMQKEEKGVSPCDGNAIRVFRQLSGFSGFCQFFGIYFPSPWSRWFSRNGTSVDGHCGSKDRLFFPFSWKFCFSLSFKKDLGTVSFSGSRCKKLVDSSDCSSQFCIQVSFQRIIRIYIFPRIYPSFSNNDLSTSCNLKVTF